MKLRLLLISTLALGLRLFQLGRISLWLDEGASVGIARMTWPNFWHVLNLREVNMALYYFLLRGWIKIGDSEVFLRLPSVVFAVAGIAVMYRLVERVLSTRVAVISSLILSFNVLHLRYSRQVRSYGLLLFVVAITWLLHERAIRETTRRNLVLWAVVSGIAVYIHLFAGLATMAQLVCLLFTPLDRERSRAWMFASLLYSALILPILVIIDRMPALPILWIPELSRDQFADFATDFFNGGRPAVIVAILLLAASAYLLARARREERWAISIGIVGFAIPVLATIAVSHWQPSFIPRYLVAALPNLAIALAIPIARLPRWPMVASTALVIALGLPLLRDYYREPAINDFRGGVEYIADHARPGDTVFIWEPLSRPAVEYYAPKLAKSVPFPTIVYPGDTSPLKAEDLIQIAWMPEVDAISAKYPRIWVIYDIDRTPANYPVRHMFYLKRFLRNHRLVSHRIWPGRNGLQVLEFERP